jgi:hypothetical protein
MGNDGEAIDFGEAGLVVGDDFTVIPHCVDSRLWTNRQSSGFARKLVFAEFVQSRHIA